MQLRAHSFAAAAAALALFALSGARAEPDEAVLGKSRGYPVGTAATWYANWYRVGSWSAMDKVGVPVRRVARGEAVTPLPRAAQPAEIRYTFRNVGYTLDDYVEHQRVTGPLLIRNGGCQRPAGSAANAGAQRVLGRRAAVAGRIGRAVR